MNFVHRFLDRSSNPTWVYERRVRIVVETILLIACAAPVVTGWRTLVAQLVVGALRLHQAETAREKASIMGRFAEVAGPADSLLPIRKRERLRVLDARDAIITWVWPVLVPVVQAADARAFGLAVSIGVLATMTRVVYDKMVVPAWRMSRVTWRAETTKTRRAHPLEALR